MKKPFNFLVSLFKRTTPPPAKRYTVIDMLQFIRNSKSSHELSKVQASLELCREDYNNSEFVEISSEIVYQRLLFATIKADFPHDYYPPFSMMYNIKLANTYVMLDTIVLHLLIHAKKYSTHTLIDFMNAIRARKEQLLILTQNQYDTTI